MYNVDMPMTNTQLMSEIPFSSGVTVAAIVCVALLAAMTVYAFVQDRKEKAQDAINSLEDNVELDMADEAIEVKKGSSAPFKPFKVVK